MSYATDGKCHNAQPGTYGHECGKPAEWIGEKSGGFRSGFCAACRQHGYEARDVIRWEPFSQAHEVARVVARDMRNERGVVDEVAMRRLFDALDLALDTRTAVWRAVTNPNLWTDTYIRT